MTTRSAAVTPGCHSDAPTMMPHQHNNLRPAPPGGANRRAGLLPASGAPASQIGVTHSSRHKGKTHHDGKANATYQANPALVAFMPPESVNDTDVLYQRRIETLHGQLRHEIGQYLVKKSKSDNSASDNARNLLGLDSQNINVRHVAGSCERIQAMLTQLDEETRSDSKENLNKLMMGHVSDGGGAANDKKPEPTRMEEPDDVLALRAFASDDTTLETTSVADYAADPPPAPAYRDDCIQTCIDEMFNSAKKMLDSNELIAKLAKDTPQWWNSAIILRRLKTHTIRTNYHARKARLWGDQCRSHLFVHSSVVNKIALDATHELRDLRVKQNEVDAKKAKMQSLSNKLDLERQELQSEWDNLREKAGNLDEQVQNTAKKCLRMDLKEAELAALLKTAGAGGTADQVAGAGPEEAMRQARNQQRNQKLQDVAKAQHQKLNGEVTEDCELALLLTKLTVIPEYSDMANSALKGLGASWGTDPIVSA